VKTLIIAAAFAVVSTPGVAQTKPSATDVARWKQEAQRVTITRDDWGIPHIHGHSDADAVFGLMYAQAEDDFNRVEMNYLTAMGRVAEVEGLNTGAVYRDLRMRLFVNEDSARAQYARSPVWLKALMNSFADGLNYYLYTHPATVPKAITRFEPWMALTFTEGSIGGDFEHASLSDILMFYGDTTPPLSSALGYVRPPDASGSNGVAIAPSNTANHHTLLLINPHTSFFFRAEVQVTSDEGLNAYGAVTWGQFFVYQGFNAHVGWMHTSTGADDFSEYAETVTRHGNGFVYKYGNASRPVVATPVTIRYMSPKGMLTRRFTVYRTLHGPIVGAKDGAWLSLRIMQDPIHALIQSYTRTKATDYASFRKTMDLHTNSSNNTIFADATGDIAYFHANFIPRRDPRFDWTKPVDGSDPATDWHGLLSVDETPHLLNPASGWLYNSNNWPWSAAGASSPRRADFPAYVELGTAESPRGLHALRLFDHTKGFTIQSLIDAAYDSYLPAFAALVPPLVNAWDALPGDDPLKARLSEQIAALRGWDYRWSQQSIPTTLAVYWGQEMDRRVRGGIYFLVDRTTPAERLAGLAAASDTLTADFGTWKTPWGDVNRFQRLTDDLVQPYNDSRPSLPVGFPYSEWGSLAAFGARTYPGTKKMYGDRGNSFVAVVEFGDSVRARAITAGGESGDPSSRHFNDQALRYTTGDLREVYFYPNQLTGHVEREYHPGA
jgi:acyl-homoserine-lactone acylase